LAQGHRTTTGRRTTRTGRVLNPPWWAVNREWFRKLNDWHGLELIDPAQLLEGTLIILRAGPAAIVLSAHRRFFIIEDRRREMHS